MGSIKKSPEKEMFRKFPSTVLAFLLLATLCSSAVSGNKQWRKRVEGKIDYLIETHVPVVFRIETTTPGGLSFLIDSISYNNTDCGVTTGVVIDDINAYEYVDTTGRCGDITIIASFDGMACVGLNGVPVPQGNFQIDLIQLTTICCISTPFDFP